MKMVKKVLSVALSAAICMSMAAGCSGDGSSSTSGSASGETQYKDFNADGKIKIAYICKFASSVWFAPKVEAMQARADELGIELSIIDCNNKEDLCTQGVDTAIAQDVDGVILTAVNYSLTPAIAAKCREAGIALMTTDDSGTDDLGNPIPHVGLDDYALGEASAKAMVEAAKERGFDQDFDNLRVAIMDYPKSESFHNRLVGGYDVIKEAFPDLPEANYLWLDTKDGLLDNVTNMFSSAYQANSSATHWIVLGGDENSIAGTMPIFDENGVDYKNVLFSGVCGSDLGPKNMDQSEDKANAVYFSGILPRSSGTTTIDVMADFLQNGVEMPEFTAYPENVCDASNYKENFVDQL